MLSATITATNIMIDFVKCIVTDHKSVQNLWANPLLYFEKELSTVNKLTGEILKTKTKHYEGIAFNLMPHTPKNANEATERLEILFKPHYWFNNGIHNANEYTPSKAITTIQRFIALFDIHNPEQFKVVNLEYGLNFITDGYGMELISYPMYHSKDEFIRDTDYQYSKKKKSTKYLIIKLYSKGVQFPEFCPKDTLRFEVKSKRSKRINPLGVHHLGDLLRIDPYYKMKTDIIANAKKVLIIDPYPIYDGLSKKQINKLKEYSNPSFWFKTINQTRKSAFDEKKKTYFNYLDKTGNNINRKLTQSIEQKLTSLFEENRINSAPLEKNENRINSPMLKEKYIPVSYSRVCPITGMDITMQKDGSKLLSNTGLKHLERTDKERFEELQSILLTGQYNKFEKTVYDKMSKQIRNRYNNKRPIPEQTILFQ